MTAVTTAGLLAGLFGSAFVPAVRAADLPAPAAGTAPGVCVSDNTATTSPGYDGAAADGGGVTQYYVRAGKKVLFNYCVGSGTLADDAQPRAAGTAVSVTVSGGVIAAYTPGTMTGVVVSPAGTSMTFNTDGTATAAELAAFNVTVTATSTVGSTVKVTFEFTNVSATPSLATTTVSRSVKTIAASRLKATLPVQTGGSTTTITGGTITQNATTLDWSDTHDSTGAFVFVPVNDYGTGITGELVTVSSSNANILNVHMAATSIGTLVPDNAAGTYTVATTNTTGVNIGVYPTQDEAGTATLTIAVDGVVVWTKTFTVLGPVATLTATQTMSYLAVGGSMTESSTLNIASIVAKDKGGSVLTTPALDYYKAGFISTDVNQTVTSGTAYVGFAAGLCATAGTTREIQAKHTYVNADFDDVTVSSAAWTVTCTGTAGKITKLAFDKAAYLPSSAIKINATAVDSGGRPLGYGATSIDTTGELTFVKQGTIVLPGAGANEITFTGWDDGVAESTATAHSATGDFGLVITIADNDLGTAVVPESISIVSTVSNILSSAVDGTLVAGPKKLKATATFGASAAGKKIAFTLENARTGAVKTYYRKANASGVATFTLSFGGTFEVTAAYGDYMTGTVTLKK